LKNLNAELGIEVDFNHLTTPSANMSRSGRFRSGYQKREYGGGNRSRYFSGRDYKSRNSGYGYGRNRDRDRDSADGYGGYEDNDNRYHSRLKGITKPLGRRNNTRDYNNNF
jgi:hypothetical protein